MDAMTLLIIQLVVGAVGGNLAGVLMPGKSLGLLWNSVLGILGGGIGAYLLNLIGIGGGGLAFAIAAAFVGGAVLLLIISLFRQG